MKTIQNTLLMAALVSLLGAGCATYKDQAKTMTGAWSGGRPDLATKQFSAKADKKDNSKDGVIWNLEAATAYRAIGDYTNSNRYFDQAVAQIEDYEQKAKVRVGNEIGAMMSNLQTLPYEGKSYDKIMLHTYRALNYLALGESEKARPEIIRAYQRQQDAVDENAKRIEKAREAEDLRKSKAHTEATKPNQDTVKPDQDQAKVDKDQEKAAKAQALADKAKADPKVSAALESVTKDLEGFKFYADYVNPFTVYLDGLFFLHAGSGGSDLERAIKSLNRVVEVAGENKFVQADLQAATNALTGQLPSPCTYVLFETGQAASLGQLRIRIPIIVTKVSYVGAAFPKLERHTGEAPHLLISAGDAQERTAPLASIDAVIALGFKNEFPVVVTKTMVAVVAKGVAAYTINQAAGQQSDLGGLFAQVITAVAQDAVNIADTRSWTTLPKEFQVARIPTPANRTLTVATDGGSPTEVKLLEGTVNVVYVKSITATSPLLISQFKLK